MKITENEMRGLLTGKCVPGDMKVNEELPAYLVRKFAALQQKLDAAEKKVEKFAVQCAAAKIAAAYAKEGRHDYSLNTPDIDTYLNSVRAEGIQIAIDTLKALDASPYAIHSLECKLHELRAGETK
ncbi:hypothetical protein MHZ90_14740 [Pantoea sp. ACRSH]|uniref:hypothetical protein n=1 Tax=unclassified Pantoea TaxID=2630326 RepID=UPI001EF55B52|nr:MULTISPECIES: hypothetical protein [unclassified Pantoea]MCG7367378.1 hypothetical protein [Pantoea sp. ACRSH]MCG7397671.1 hypothetical protein [Pantoea sp. ACRSC]